AALGTEEGKGPLPWTTFEQFLKSVWDPLVKGEWEAALHQGGLWRAVAPAAVTPKIERVDSAAAKLEGPADGFALLAYPSLRFYDGRSATRAWLQEGPDPMPRGGRG